jgi:hypothetical protein
MIRVMLTRASPIRRIHLHIRASWAWASLDREIAEGALIETSAARQLRAEQLLRPEERVGIAAAIRNILDAAAAARTDGRNGERAEADAIFAQRDRLVELIELLRSDTPMTARAVARAELLACDGHGPLLRPGVADAIAEALGEIAPPRPGRRAM